MVHYNSMQIIMHYTAAPHCNRFTKHDKMTARTLTPPMPSAGMMRGLLAPGLAQAACRRHQSCNWSNCVSKNRYISVSEGAGENSFITVQGQTSACVN